MRFKSFIVLFFWTFLLIGQTNSDKVECVTKLDTLTKRTIYTEVDSMPHFPGGYEELLNFLGKNVTWNSNGKKQKVYGSFIVEKDGTLTNIVVLKGENEAANKDALRVMKLMPKWIPGQCKGKKVPVRYVIPIQIMI
jgi:protein TonB